VSLNPNFVLAAIVALALAAIVAVLYVLGQHGTASDQVVQVGLVTAIAVPVLTSLFALFNSARAASTVNGVTQAVSDHGGELEAAQARIAFLEQRLGVQAPPQPPRTT
jgi:hypothetical protein